MPTPRPRMPEFLDGQDFDTQENLDVLNNAVLQLRDKFGSLMKHDLSSSTLETQGAVSAKGNLVSGLSEALSVINMGERGSETVDQVVANMTTGGVLFLPPNRSFGITTPILMQDDVWIIGSGPSSSIFCITGAGSGFDCIQDNGAKRWGIRSFRINTKRTFHTIGNGVSITNLASAEVAIEDMLMGPIVGGAVSNAIANYGVYVSNSDSVRITGCRFSKTGLAGIGIFSGSSSITIEDNDIIDSGANGIFVGDGTTEEWILMLNNRVRRSSQENLKFNGVSHMTVHQNEFYNGVTDTTITTKSNVIGDLSQAVTIHENIFEELAPDVRNSVYQLDHDSTDDAKNLIVTANWFAHTTNTAAQGKTVNLTVGTNVVSTTGSESGYVRDNNQMVNDFFEEARFNQGGRQGHWASTDYIGHSCTQDESIAGGFQRFFSENLSHPGVKVPPGKDPINSARHFFWTDTGQVADEKKLTLPEVLGRCSNPGSLLTPSVLYSNHTNLSEEVQAIHATFNIHERRAADPLTPSAPGGFTTGRGYNPRDSNVALPTVTGPYHGAGQGMWGFGDTAVLKRGHHVLTAHILSESPYALGTAGGCVADGSGEVVVIWSGSTHFLDNVSWYPRPVWATIHI